MITCVSVDCEWPMSYMYNGGGVCDTCYIADGSDSEEDVVVPVRKKTTSR